MTAITNGHAYMQPKKSSIPVPEVKVTFDYKQFKTLLGNRFKSPGHVRNLEKSIQESDLTPFRPILVNRYMQVIDGQHTLEAEKNLGLPVYYMVAPDANGTDVIRLNAFSANWELQDYLNYYVQLGKKEYIELKAFMEQNHLNLSNSLSALTMNFQNWGRNRYEFRKGEFKILYKEEAQKMVDELSSLRNYALEKVLDHREFLRAYQNLRNMVEFEVFLEQLQRSNQKLTRALRSKDYMRQFEDILNYKKQKLTRLF